MNWKEIFDKNLGVYSGIIRNYLIANCESKIILLENCLQKINYPTKGKLLTTFYKENGIYPIVDQGKRFIAGYIDDKSFLVKDVQPVIVFGDHTRILKYIDFDFALGADGVKLIKPLEKFNAKFFYYQMFGFEFEEKGYSRYYKQLSQKDIILPYFSNQVKSSHIQNAIVDFLDDLSMNNLHKSYFDPRTEEKILKMQRASLILYDLLTNILPLQNSYLRQLRQVILQEAVQGKLTKQNKDDEPADKLLNRIKAEKQKLIVASKLKKEKELPPITEDEIPFELPKGWVWCRLGEISDFINGDRSKIYPNRHEYVAEGIPWINTGHIEPDGSLSKTEMHFITREKFNSLRGGKIERGDLVYCLRGATIGKTAFIEQFDEGAIASSLMIIRLEREISRWYTYYYLTGPLGKSEIKKFDNGSAQPNLSANSVTLYLFPLPPLSEQQRIIAKVQQLLQMVNQLEQQVAQSQTQAQQLLQAVLKDAFTSKEKVYEENEMITMEAEE